MQFVTATEQNRLQIIQLLQSQNLPFQDLPTDLSNFCVVMQEEKVIGLIGLERYGRCGLLRSMVVHPDYRNKSIAGKLVNMLEERAKESGVETMYLLTETAENYFDRKGYDTITRNDVPDALKQSSEFSHVCPISATVMKKELIEHTTSVS